MIWTKSIMATYIIDLDGTFFKYGTMDPTSRAVETVNTLQENGHKVIFITKRRKELNDPPHLNLDLTLERLNHLGVKYNNIIGDVENPRILIDDDAILSINHTRNSPLQSSLP